MDRYARQTILAEIGPEGQERLRAARVLCVGAGGLGSAALPYLAAAGIGTLGVADADVVEVSNLQRQIIYTMADVGRPKAGAAVERLSALNPEVRFQAHPERVVVANVLDLFADYDIIIDGTDNFASKFLINDAAVKLGKPMIYAAILGFEGQLSSFWAEHGPCYRCLYPEMPREHIPSCAEAGVIGAVAGMFGVAQAMEAIKLALGLDHCREHGLEPLLGRLWLMDMRGMTSRSLKIGKDGHCPVCSKAPQDIMLADEEPVCAMVAAGDEMAGIFIDVREPVEWQQGVIPGAIKLPLSQIRTDPDAFATLERDQPYIVYCQHGVRSRTVAAMMVQAGFTQIANLDGGFVTWTGEVSR